MSIIFASVKAYSWEIPRSGLLVQRGYTFIILLDNAKLPCMEIRTTHTCIHNIGHGTCFKLLVLLTEGPQSLSPTQKKKKRIKLSVKLTANSAMGSSYLYHILWSNRKENVEDSKLYNKPAFNSHVHRGHQKKHVAFVLL